MMTLEQIRQRNKAENAAAQRLQAAGYRLEGWDPRTGQRIAAQITGENTNDERRTFYAFPTCRMPPPLFWAERPGHLSRAAPQSDPAPLPRQPPGDHPEHTPRTERSAPHDST